MTSDGGDTGGHDALELLWGDVLPARRGPKPTLSVERIVHAGIDIADSDGLAAVSMSRVAKTLGSPLMSLYRYVHSKSALVDLMLDTVIGPPPDLSGLDGWRARLEHWANRHETLFREHPWALPLVTASHVVGPHEMAWLEAALDAVSGIGLTDSEMLEVVLLTNAYARGSTQAGTEESTDHGWGTVYAHVFQRDAARDRYPTVARLYDSGTFDRRVESFGLDRVLDGVQTYLDGRLTR